MIEHRPMRRNKRELTNAEDLLGVVEKATVVRVGFADEEGVAIFPLSYGFDWDASGEKPALTLWLHGANEGRKADAWLNKMQVAIEIDVEVGVTTGTYSCAYSYAYESLMGDGVIAPVADANEKLHGLTRIMEHMAPGAPVHFSEEGIERVAVWRIDVTRLTGKRREAQG